MSYMPLCMKHGIWLLPTAIAAPAFIGLAGVFTLAALKPDMPVANLALTEVCFMAGGFLGGVAAVIAEMVADSKMHGRHAGITEGSRIIQRAQALSFAAVAGGFMALGVACLKLPAEPSRADAPAPVALPQKTPPLLYTAA